ncbi:MAG: tetratricopeptide repeat protein [Hyphomicrobium sp.]|nr:tetratricopeptide repeat protein [Hyphomicrobium sp.]
MLLPVASSRAADRWRPVLAAGLTGLVCSACAGSGTAPLGLADPHVVSEPNSLATGSITQQDLPPPTTPATKVAVADIEVSAPVAASIRKARDLRAAGKKAEALELLDRSAGADTDRAIIGERGLLALELGQIDKSVALLARAQNPVKPDWRMQSAYGAALSAAGRQKEAQDQFSKALAAAPGQPSILNNLALSYALEGRKDEAETTLRQAAAQTGDPQARQNLALVLGLNGKTGEASAITKSTLPPEKAKENLAYFEKLGRTRVSEADGTATLPPMKSASITADKPIMQLGVPD